MKVTDVRDSLHVLSKQAYPRNLKVMAIKHVHDDIHIFESQLERCFRNSTIFDVSVHVNEYFLMAVIIFDDEVRHG